MGIMDTEIILRPASAERPSDIWSGRFYRALGAAQFCAERGFDGRAAYSQAARMLARLREYAIDLRVQEDALSDVRPYFEVT